jgi:hypothetical protein
MPSAGMHISILFKGCTPTCVLYVLELEDKPITVPANIILGRDGTVEKYNLNTEKIHSKYLPYIIPSKMFPDFNLGTTHKG